MRPLLPALVGRLQPRLMAVEHGDLDDAADRDGAGKRRAELEALAEKHGMVLQTFTVTPEPMPDPRQEAMAPADQARLDWIAQRLRGSPARHVKALKGLLDRYPDVPMIYNFLSIALHAAGEREQGDQIIAETARRFPDYLFGFCNFILLLLRQDRIDEARALVEQGPSGPLLSFMAFHPERTTFHTTEVAAYCHMAGKYLLALNRIDEAMVQLDVVNSVAPDHPQTDALAREVVHAIQGQLMREAARSFGERPGGAAKRRYKSRRRK